MFGRAGKGLVDSEGPWLIPQIVWQFWMGLWVRRLQTCISVTHIYVASIVKVIGVKYIFVGKHCRSQMILNLNIFMTLQCQKSMECNIFMLMERQSQVIGVK